MTRLTGLPAPAERREYVALAAVLLVGALIRLPVAAIDWHVIADVRILEGWARTIADRGLVEFTQTVSQRPYPPLSLMLLGTAGVADDLMPNLLRGNALIILLVKLPGLLGDLVIGWLVWLVLAGRPALVRLGAATFMVMNPAFWYLSGPWGMPDALYVAGMVASMAVLARHAFGWSWLLWGLAVATKLQALALAPILALVTLRDAGIRRMVAGLTVVTALWVLLCLPWLTGGGIDRYLAAAFGTERRVDVSAFNVWYLAFLGMIRGVGSGDAPLGLPIGADVVGAAALAVVTLVVAVALWRGGPRAGIWLPAAILSLGAYTLLTAMHERYMLAAIPFTLLFAAGADGSGSSRGGWLAFVALTATQTFNLVAYAPPLPNVWLPFGSLVPPYDTPIAIYKALGLAAAATNVVVLGWLITALVRRPAGPHRRQTCRPLRSSAVAGPA